jgi:hypothetical protein
MPAAPFSGPRIALGALLLAYAALLLSVIGAVPGGSDNSGYFNEGRLFLQGRIRAPMREIEGVPEGPLPYLYVPFGFRPAPDASPELVPTYPPGLPLLLAASACLAGWTQAGNLVLAVHALAGLALVYALGRRCGLPGYWALGGALLLAASPLYLFLSAQALSDVPAAVWATAAVLAAFASRETPGWALASGLCVSVGFLVRPSNFLVVIPVLAAAGLSPRRLALLALGTLPGIAAWAAINHSAYGHALESGYGDIGSEFHASLVGGALLYYVRWLPLIMSPVILLAPALPFVRGLGRRVPWVLTLWAASFIVFYCPYRWTTEAWWFLRFLIPAAPALLVAGLLVLHRWLGGQRRRHGFAMRQLPLALLVASLGIMATQAKAYRQACTIGTGERKYGLVADWVRAGLPPDAVVATCQASGALFYYTDLTIIRCDEVDPGLFERIRGILGSEGRPLYAVLFPFEKHYLATMPGKWEEVGSVDDVVILRSGDPGRPR